MIEMRREMRKRGDRRVKRRGMNRINPRTERGGIRKSKKKRTKAVVERTREAEKTRRNT